MHVVLLPRLDVALLVLYAFFGFFLGLVVYLRREDRREGYPLEDDLTGEIFTPGGPLSLASPKTFHLPFGRGTYQAPPGGGRDPFNLPARHLGRFHGAPLVPTGNPLIDGIGPASWVERGRHPDLDMEGHPRIVRLSRDTAFTVAIKDPDMIGWPVLGTDKKIAGVVSDLWIDRADRLVRYLHVTLDGSAKPVLAPMMMAKLDRRRRRVVVHALQAHQFADAPMLDEEDVITLYEEERVQAYFGGGYLYATPARQEPLL